ncbi:hypothetical protein [Streptomyces sp. AF1A]|jgi:hypothetical protein|uniref:hypothetical protein n=1 Tax=Streptomyces sp. AF1A TaxID=3394350 RepID=UPI0039BC76AB
MRRIVSSFGVFSRPVSIPLTHDPDLPVAPTQVGYCPRCPGLTHRYGPGAEVVCRACRAVEALPDWAI